MLKTTSKSTALSFAAVITLALLAPCAWAQDIESHPGYADLDTFERSLAGELDFDLDLDKASLAALVSLAGPGNEELSTLVNSVEGVRARVYDLQEGLAEGARQSLGFAADELKLTGWNTLVSVRDDTDRVEVLLRNEGEHVLGLTALFVDDDEAGYANVVGDVTMAQILTLAPNLDGLRSFLEGMKNRGEQDGGKHDG